MNKVAELEPPIFKQHLPSLTSCSQTKRRCTSFLTLRSSWKNTAPDTAAAEIFRSFLSGTWRDQHRWLSISVTNNFHDPVSSSNGEFQRFYFIFSSSCKQTLKKCMPDLIACVRRYWPGLQAMHVPALFLASNRQCMSRKERVAVKCRFSSFCVEFCSKMSNVQ